MGFSIFIFTLHYRRTPEPIKSLTKSAPVFLADLIEGIFSSSSLGLSAEIYS